MKIINDDNLYSNMDRRQLENAIVRNMILKDRRFDGIKDKLPCELCNRLINRKKKLERRIRK